MKKLLFIVCVILYSLHSFAQRVKTPPTHSQAQIQFTENKSQWNNHISYKAQLDGGALFVEKTGKLTFHLYDKDNYRSRHLGKIISPNLKFHSYSINFIGSNITPQIIANNITEDYSNYFVGENSANWASNVHHYKNLLISELYNNIDALYFGGKQSIKYNFIVKPNGNPNEIKIHYVGVNSIKLKNGELYISTTVSESIEQKPFVYQIINEDTLEIASKFVLKDNVVSFKLLKEYDHNHELIIDPLLVFAASSGSTADNFGMTATYDSRGSLYTGGTTFDIGYPTTVGAYDVSFNNFVSQGQTDVVITKYDSSGVFLKYSTYLGGNNAEIVTSLVVDKNDNLCLYGATGSSNFPTTVGCYDNTFNGGTYISFVFNGTTFNNGTDIFAAKLNSNGNTLLSSTYIGGSENDGINYNNAITSYTSPYGNVTEYPPDSLQYNYGDQYRGEIQIDTLDNIYIYSSTKSSDFPTLNAFDNTLGGKQDAVLIKFNPTLSGLVFSTFIGGSDNDAGYALALDDTLNIYVTGGTRSSNFPTTAGSYKTTYGGGKCDGYICKIKQNGSSIIHASYIGTTNYDQSYFVQLDGQQNIYLYGQSLGNMPITAGVYSNANSKQFIQKLNPQLNSLLASTVIGNGNGNINISPSAFSVDCAGNIYLSGWGGNIIFLVPTSGMPLTANAIQSSTDSYNFYLMVLAPNMSNLLFGSYFGGALSHEHVDGGTSRFDKNGIIYQSVCAGCTNNDDFPVTPGAWPNNGSNVNYSSNCNNGVFKIDFQLNSAVANISASTISGCMPLTVNFTNNSTPGHAYLWDFGTNDTTSTIFNPIKTFTAAGTYTTNLYVKTSICNTIYDTAKIIITVHPKPLSNFIMTVDSCSNNVSFINQTSPLANNTKWYLNSVLISNSTNTSYSFLTAGTYTVKLTSQTNFGCKDSITQTIIVPVDSIKINPPQSKCSYQTVTLQAQGGASYSWQPITGLSNSLIANPTCSVQTTTIYTVSITQNSLLGKQCVKTLTTSVTVYPKINSQFSYFIGACGNNVQFTDSSFINPIAWQWDFGNTNSSSVQNPEYFYGVAGIYTVALIATNSFGCKDTSEQVVNLSGFTTVAVNTPAIKCELDSVQLNASGGVYYLWQPGASLSDSTINNPIAFASSTTIYTVTISTIQGTDTCKSSLTTTVSVYPFANSTASISVSATTLTLGQSSIVTLNGFVNNGTLTVFPNTNVSILTNTTIAITPTKPGEYTIYFTDVNGCAHILKTIFIDVKTNICDEGVVYLPTGFTPNNDGTNDILYIRSNFITEVYLTIYDRWGEKLFETFDIKKGWDGNFKGKLLDQGVYGYYMTFKCNNGEESFKKGNITLTR
jgi:gliding motility-associated-like protein